MSLKPGVRITAEMIAKHDPCEDFLLVFRRTFPDGTTWRLRNLRHFFRALVESGEDPFHAAYFLLDEMGDVGESGARETFEDELWGLFGPEPDPLAEDWDAGARVTWNAIRDYQRDSP